MLATARYDFYPPFRMSSSLSENTGSERYDFRRILVTGGAGFIGQEMVRQLYAMGKEVVVFDRESPIEKARKNFPTGVDIVSGSVLDSTDLREAMDGCDAVIHLAAVLGVQRTEEQMLYTIEVNINGTQNVLAAAHAHGIKKILLSSSSEVYGEPTENPIRETTPTQGKSVYGVTKLAGEELCKAYHQKYPQLAYTIVRYFNVYGPSQVSEFVLTRFISAVMKNESPTVFGDGSQVRAFCYVEDCCRGTIEALLRKNADSEVLNVGNSSEPVSMKELAERVIRLMGRAKEIELVCDGSFENSNRSKNREIFNRIVDISKAKMLINYKPSVSLDEGIRKVIDAGMPLPAWKASRSKATEISSTVSA